MKALIGRDASPKQRDQPIYWDTEKLINGHMLILGTSGAGKTTMLRRLIRQLRHNRVRIHVFDVHGDIRLDGASEVLFSEQTPHGLNPLRINPDPHFGGVRKSIQNFIATINRASPTPLGVKQEAVIRNLLADAYRLKGFKIDDPATWLVDESRSHLVSDGSDGRLYLDVPLAEKEQAKAFGARWDAERRCWWIAIDQYAGGITRWGPKTVGRSHLTLSDAVQYARRLLKISFLGSDQEAVTELEIFHRQAASFQRKVIDAVRRGEKAYENAEASEAVDKARLKALDSYTRYLEAVRTGHELEELIRYDSTDVLKSVVDRLESLQASGIFKNSPPPFDPTQSVWTYRINPLSKAEKQLFVFFKLQEIYANGFMRGEQNDVVEIVALDEAGMFVDGDGAGILSTLARESRKFGISIIAANQNADMPEDFLASLGTKVVLGLDELFWRQAISRMRIDEELLRWIKPTRTLAVQLKERGSTRNEWRYVLTDNSQEARPAVDAAAVAGR